MTTNSTQMTGRVVRPTEAITIVSKQCGKFRNHTGPCDDSVEFVTPHAEDQCVVGIPVLKHDDRVLIDGMATDYTVRAVVVTLGGYGAKNRSYEGPDGMAKYAKALERNEKHGGAWISVEATVISAYREVEKPRTIVRIGGLVRIVSDVPGEGGIYRIEFYSRWDHHNVLLVRP